MLSWLTIPLRMPFYLLALLYALCMTVIFVAFCPKEVSDLSELYSDSWDWLLQR